MKYETDTIVLGDVLEFLSRLPDGIADLIVADPPYSIDKNFGSTTPRRSFNDWLSWCGEWLSETTRVLAPSGNLLVYSLHSSSAFLHVAMHELGLVYRRQIIWHYENGFSTYKRAPAAEYEVILWFAHVGNSTFNPLRKPYKSQVRLRYKVTKNGKEWNPNPEGRLEGDVWNIPTLAGRRFADEKVNHPTQKPLTLSSKLITQFSNPGDMVVVPFVGSGSECVAAKMHGRHFVGVEINPEYLDIAGKRLSAVQRQIAGQNIT